MFEIIAEGFQAYNQIGLLLGALACLGIGGLILGSTAYWRMHALRASGTVIGVLVTNGTYTPVYRYTLPDGQSHEAKSDTSSSAVAGKETGRIVPLLISPLIVPVVVTAVGTYLFYARIGLANSYLGIILAHTVLASPFVVVTVGASLSGFDRNLMRATAILGAKPLTGFFRVMLPLILKHMPAKARIGRI